MLYLYIEINFNRLATYKRVKPVAKHKKNVMSKVNAKDAMMAKLLAITTANTTKTRGASGKITYLDRFVGILLNEDGTPGPAKTREAINAEMSYDICVEVREAQIASGEKSAPFNFDDVADLEEFAGVNEKCKNMIAAAVSDSNNSTALSYNAAYKEVWKVVKNGKLVSLAAKTATEVTEESELTES